MIQYFSETITFDLKYHKEISLWIENCAQDYERFIGEINYVFCDDEFLLEMNKKFLNHNYYTDVISFNDSNESILNGEIYISVDRIKENAKNLSLTFENELFRILIHGILHFIGFHDSSEEEKNEMREQENYCLSKVYNFIPKNE